MLPNADKVNTTNNAGLTPLQMAALRGDTNVVRFQTEFNHDLWIIFKVPWRLELEPVIRMSHENISVIFQKLQICPN